MDILLQAEKDVNGAEKYRYIADRYKELVRDEESFEFKELSKVIVRNLLKGYYKNGEGVEVGSQSQE
jgi:hypothetical protein